ncbi:MAG TPA: hypothetical protein VE913_08675 [Longimicrobium sp.]|nr:hypothetical protein [Longimicrobium sp.]
MKAKGWLATALLVLGAAACGSGPVLPTPGAAPSMDGGGLMGSGARIDAAPPSQGLPAAPDSTAG